MRVDTLIPEVKVRYMPGLDEARWYSIHCEEFIPAWGQTIEYCYQIEDVIPDDDKDRPAWSNYIVTDRRCPDHQSFPWLVAERIVKDTAMRFICDIVKQRGEIEGIAGFANLKNSELWVVVEPMPEMTEDEVW